MSGKPAAVLPPPSEPRRRRILPVQLSLSVLIPAALLALYALGIGLCPMRELTGVPCPGCGITRASIALLRFDFEEALQLHPLVPIVFPLAIYGFGRMFLQGIGAIAPNEPGLLSRLPNWGWIAAVVVMWIVWGVRLALGMHPDL